MSIKTKLQQISLRVLRTSIRPTDEYWMNLKPLARVHGEDKVCEAFEQWATANQNDPPKYPLSAFLRIADQLISDPPPPDNPDLQGLIQNMVDISEGSVFWDKLRSAQINRLISKFPATEVENAFVKFWESIRENKYYVQYASNTFIDVAPQFVALNSRTLLTQASALQSIGQRTGVTQ